MGACGLIDTENEIYLGIEVHETYCVAYYCDGLSKKIYPMDITGGFGQLDIPLAIKYLEGDNLILIGEEAIRNHDNDVGPYYENIKQKDLMLFRDYQKVLKSHLTHINPNAEVKNTCIIDLRANEGSHFMQQDPWLKNRVAYQDMVCIDYGYREVKLIEITDGAPIVIKEVKHIPGIGFGDVLDAGVALITDTYKTTVQSQYLLDSEVIACEIMAHKLLPLVLQKMTKGQGITLTYSFSQEPFRIVISYDTLSGYFRSFIQAYSKFVDEIKHIYGEIKILLIGPGIKLPWTRTLVHTLLAKKDSDDQHYYAKLATYLAAEGYQKDISSDEEKYFVFEKGDYEVKIYRLKDDERQLVLREVFKVEADLCRMGMHVLEKVESEDRATRLELIREVLAL